MPTSRRRTPPPSPQKPSRAAAEVQQLIELARAQGLKSLEVDGVKFEFRDGPPPGTPRPKGPPPRRMPSGWDMLRWSTGEVLDFELDEDQRSPGDPRTQKARA